MTRARQKIIEAVESRGYTVHDLEWEPCIPGGLTFRVEPDPSPPGSTGYGWFGGLSWQEAVENIERWLPARAVTDADIVRKALDHLRLIAADSASTQVEALEAKAALDRLEAERDDWHRSWKRAEDELHRTRKALREIADTFEIDWHEAQVIAREALSSRRGTE